MCDKFYTKPEIAEKCVSILNEYLPNINTYDWIEPSAGNGKFMDAMPGHVNGYDIKPERSDIIQQNFLEFVPTKNTSLLGLIGNPPFGPSGKLAVQFINHAASFCDIIAFILPASFCRMSIQNKLDRRLRLVKSVMLPSDSFIPKTNSKVVFQIFEKNDSYMRPVIPLPRESRDFKFISCNSDNINDPNVILFQGEYNGYGKVLKPNQININKMKRYYCIKPEPCKLDLVRDKLILLEPEFVKYGQYSVGVPGISQQSIVLIYSQSQL